MRDYLHSAAYLIRFLYLIHSHLTDRIVCIIIIDITAATHLLATIPINITTAKWLVMIFAIIVQTVPITTN
jgi:hypothetical protein